MSVRIEVWGRYAMFTRPEFKAERVSYDVMTPSAAKGILEAIYWHPGMRWIVDSIQVLNPIRFENIQTSELPEKIKISDLDNISQGKSNWTSTVTAPNQIRNSRILRDVRYVITARFEMTDKKNKTDSPDKFQAIITHRIKKGAVYRTPYLGQSKYLAFIKKAECGYVSDAELKGRKDLGLMLYDIDYDNNKKPLFFRAEMIDGIIRIPAPASEEVISCY